MGKTDDPEKKTQGGQDGFSDRKTTWGKNWRKPRQNPDVVFNEKKKKRWIERQRGKLFASRDVEARVSRVPSKSKAQRPAENAVMQSDTQTLSRKVCAVPPEGREKTEKGVATNLLGQVGAWARKSPKTGYLSKDSSVQKNNV